MSTPGDLIIDGFSDEMEKLGGAKMMIGGLLGLSALPGLAALGKQKALQATIYKGYRDPGARPGAPRWHQRYGSSARGEGGMLSAVLGNIALGTPQNIPGVGPWLTPRRSLHALKDMVPGASGAASHYAKKFPGVAKALHPKAVWKPPKSPPWKKS